MSVLIGYVSDEMYSPISDVLVEIQRAGAEPLQVRSSASGAVYADLQPGTYRVTLSREGFGSKHTEAEIAEGKLHQFRLLRDGLVGFAWPKWVRSGEKSEFRVHSTEAYRLSLWRYGIQKREVALIGWFDEHAPRAAMQILPDGDFTQTGVEFNKRGYPSIFPGQQVTAPGQSGLYFFHAETESGRFFSFPWVVAPAAPSAKIAVLASTNTWNAYNNFGGRSNYINPEGLPPRPATNSRQELNRYTGEIRSVWQFENQEYPPLSFERPEPFNSIPRDEKITDPIRGRQSSHLVAAEWRLLGWLEGEGYSYDFYSDYHLHNGELPLDSYQVLIISTHPEYWSREQYQRVKDWVVNRGGKLMYLGGNGIDCEVEFLEGDRLRFLTHYPGEVPGAPVPGAGPAGSTLECRFQLTTGESPAALLGVVFEESGIATGAPFTVTDESSWIYAGTNLHNGDTFGTATLHERCPGGASGHETDKRSPSTPGGAQFVARGQNKDNGGAEIATIDWPSGGRVFSVGSITWPSCVMVDSNISRITRNVLEEFLKVE